MDQVFGTAELLEAILLAMRLDDFLRARQVCTLWKDVIERSKVLRQIKHDPYVGVNLRLPHECSFSAVEPPILEADLTLYFDKPMTIRQSPSCINSCGGFTYKFEEGTLPPKRFPEFSFAGCFRPRGLRFSRANESRWFTLWPGVPHRLHCNFRLDYRHSMLAPHMKHSGMLGAEAGKTYVLRVTPASPDRSLTALIGTKQWLLEQTPKGTKTDKVALAKPLRLVGQGEARFKAIE